MKVTHMRHCRIEKSESVFNTKPVTSCHKDKCRYVKVYFIEMKRYGLTKKKEAPTEIHFFFLQVLLLCSCKVKDKKHNNLTFNVSQEPSTGSKVY